MGPNAQITLGYVILVMAASFREGVVTLMDEDIAFGYLDYCDYNRADSPENGNTLGHAHVLDIDIHHVGEPLFNVCRSLPTLMGHACAYAEAYVIETERIGSNDKVRLILPSETCKLPGPPITPRFYCKPTYITEQIDDNIALRVCAQSKLLERVLKRKRYEQVDRALRWGACTQREAHARAALMRHIRRGSQRYGVWVEPTEQAIRDLAEAHTNLDTRKDMKVKAVRRQDISQDRRVRPTLQVLMIYNIYHLTPCVKTLPKRSIRCSRQSRRVGGPIHSKELQ